MSYRRHVEQHDVGPLEHEELGPVGLPRLLPLQHALVHPAHVLDALAHAEVAVEQLHLQRGAVG